MFCLESFKIALDVLPNAILLIVGDGKLRRDIETKIKQLDLDRTVIMLGHRKDIPHRVACTLPGRTRPLPVPGERPEETEGGDPQEPAEARGDRHTLCEMEYFQRRGTERSTPGGGAQNVPR